MNKQTQVKGIMKTEKLEQNIDPLGSYKITSNSDHGILNSNPTVEVSVEPPGQSPPALCHCCLELTCHKSLWQTYEWMGRLEKYGEMLQGCFNFDLSDQQTAKICEVCITQLRNAVRFKTQVARCQAQLREQRDVKTDDRQTKRVQEVIKEEHDDKMKGLEEQVEYYDHLNQLFPTKSEDSSDESCSKFEQRHDNSYEADEEMPETVKEIKTTNKRIKNPKRIILIKKRSKVDRRTIAFQSSKFTKPRRNVGLLLEHSTICPFKYSQAYFKCFYCTKNFLVFQELKTHVKDCHNNLAFKDIAKCITRPNDQVKADVSEISCRKCHMNCTSLEALATHLSEVHSIAFDDNPADSILGYDLADNKFKCTVCKEEFLFFKTLGKHMNEHTSNHVCDVCGKCFLLVERLRVHVRLHSEVEMKCDRCDKIFVTKPALKSHIRYVHERKPFACSICDESFPTYRKRLQHFVERHGRTPLSLHCDQCDKTFNSNNSLNRHVKYQHLMMPKEAKHTCEDCGRKFRSKRNLTGHMLVHSGEKNHECEVCKKKFGRLSSLKEHLKIHRNDKRWSCGACAACFVQKCSLKNHIRVHHAEYNLTDLIIYKNPNKENVN
ncbi:hypothetical protein ABMA27_012810 [Loxostege sticticalis]|uniref:C2H2-type domain-containing protein n=1 Tax=Loxostege sticticalis TaxID=481309 RepID=A0ABR3GZZ3_LOXSC